MPDLVLGMGMGGAIVLSISLFYFGLGPWLLGWRFVGYNVRWSDTHKRVVLERYVQWQEKKNAS